MAKQNFTGSQESRIMMVIKPHQICIICDEEETSPLATGFLFMKKNWMVTAKHVVIKDGLARQKIYAIFVSTTKEIIYAKLKVIAIHDESDIAILEILDNLNEFTHPLYPGHEELSSKKGLIYCGYDSSFKSLRMEYVDNFVRDSRFRNHEEIIIEFSSNHVTGGYSGGPIFGDGGVVLGLMINEFYDSQSPDKKFARAISINTLMQAIKIDIQNPMKWF